MTDKLLKTWFIEPDRSDFLRYRLDQLDQQERALIEMVFRDGYRPFHLAQAFGFHPSSFTRRLARIIRRLTGSEYLLCLKWRQRFSELELAVVREYYLRGRTLKTIAVKFGLTRYQVRMILIHAATTRNRILAESTAWARMHSSRRHLQTQPVESVSA